MVITSIIQLPKHPHVQAFLGNLDMHFSDMRALLQLPRPDIGITTGCNLVFSSGLCNVISGVSVTLYKPTNLNELTTQFYSGEAFKCLVRDFFPYAPANSTDFPQELYSYARNPLSHALGIDNNTWQVRFVRAYHNVHPGIGWSEQELNDLHGGGFRITEPPGVVINGNEWIMCCDSFYFDVIKLLQTLTSDAAQLDAAEWRLSQRVFNWRI